MINNEATAMKVAKVVFLLLTLLISCITHLTIIQEKKDVKFFHLTCSIKET